MKTKPSKTVSAASYAALQANYTRLQRRERELSAEFLTIDRQRVNAETRARLLEDQVKAAEAKALFFETQAKEAAAARVRAEESAKELQASLDNVRAEREAIDEERKAQFERYREACGELNDVKRAHRDACDMVQAFTLMAKRLA